MKDDTDPSKPLRNCRREAMVLGMLKGMTQVAAYRAAGYKGNDRVCASQACRMLSFPQVLARLSYLKSQAAGNGILTLAERKEMLSSAAREARRGVKPYVKRGGILDVNEDNVTGVVEQVECDENTGCIKKVKVRDFLPYLAELNKMEGQYAAEKHDVNMNIVGEALQKLELRILQDEKKIPAKPRKQIGP